MQGLGRNLAYSLAAQTMVGAGRMVLETGEIVFFFMYEYLEGGGRSHLSILKSSVIDY